MRPERAYSPAARATQAPDPSRVLVIGCGALARELVAVIDQAGLANVDLTCLPATLHNRPGGIPAAVRAKIRAARPLYERIFIAYADCGTGGLLDVALAEEGVERLSGAHCYEVYAGSAAFAAMTDQDPATFFLTDFLARNFERLVITGLGLDRHPELLAAYFGNYHRLVYLAQTDDPALVAAARRAARRLGLTFEFRRTDYGDLATDLVAAASGSGAAGATRTPSRKGGSVARRGGRRTRPEPGRGRKAIASDATNVRRAHRDARDHVDLLPPGHEDIAAGGQVVQELHLVQGARPSGSAGRRCMHSVQRAARELPQTQRTGPKTRGASPTARGGTSPTARGGTSPTARGGTSLTASGGTPPTPGGAAISRTEVA
jgi:hypothetical protein